MAAQRMYELKIYMRGSEEDAAKLAGSQMVVLPMPPGGFDTFKGAIRYTLGVVCDTREAVAAVRLILDDPEGHPDDMARALAQLARFVELHDRAASNLTNILTLLGTALEADQFGSPQDGSKGGVQ